MDISLEDRFWGHVSKDCWVWKGSTKPRNGYGHFHSRGRDYNAHRLAWELTNGPIPDGMHVLHRCDFPACVNPDHLYLGTHAENMADMQRKGRSGSRGELNKHAKLTADDVLEIRRRFKRYSLRSSNAPKLAKEYGVEEGTIYLAATGRTWKHLPGACSRFATVEPSL